MKLLALIMAIFSICLGQDQGFHDLKPQVIDRQTLAKQHYSKKEYSVITGIFKDTSFQSKKWIMIDTVIVPKGAIIRISSDVKLYFEPEATLEVNGTLEIVAQPSDSFSLSIVPSQDLLYKSDDEIVSWNGIKVGSHGRLILSNVIIKDALNGIYSDGKCDSLSLQSVGFRNVRNSALMIKKYSLQLPPDSIFTLQCSLLSPQSDISGNNKSPSVLSKSFYVISVLSAIGGCAATIFAYNIDHKVNSSTNHSQAQGYYDKATRFYTFATWSFIGSGVFLFSGLSLDIINHHKKRE